MAGLNTLPVASWSTSTTSELYPCLGCSVVATHSQDTTTCSCPLPCTWGCLPQSSAATLGPQVCLQVPPAVQLQHKAPLCEDCGCEVRHIDGCGLESLELLLQRLRS